MEYKETGIRNLRLVIIVTVLLLIISQLITLYIINNVKEESKVVIENILKLSYIENTGGAFGIGGNSTIGFVIVSLIVISIILRFIISKREMMDRKTSLSLSLILAGGISNLIDRVLRGFVVDYIDITEFLNFPVFNFADMLICVGWIILVISILIYWRKEVK